MFKIAYKLLLARKHWLFLLILSFALVFSSIISIFLSTESIKINLKKQAFQQYGEFTGIILDTKKEDNITLANDLKLGQFVLTTPINIKENKKITVGSVDRNFLELGNIKLEDGEFPINTDEMAIESSYRELIDPNWKIGQYKTFKYGDKEINFKLVGIINNYTSRWSVSPNFEKGINDFPNMIIPQNNLYNNDISYNYLIGSYNNNDSVEKNFSNSLELLDQLSVEGYINYNLFYKGLKTYNKIVILAYILKITILFLSTFSLLTILTFFNSNQRIKLGILRAIGCNNKNLYIIAFYQTVLIYLLGILFSIPLLFLFHFLIIENSYGIKFLTIESSISTILGMGTWLILLFIFIQGLSYITIRKISLYSINNTLKGNDTNFGKRFNFVDKIKNFYIKKFTIQILSNPKHSVFIILTICCSILVVLFSHTFAKENEGIWTTKIDYYLTSQETFRYKVVDGMNVLKNKGLTFSPSKVRALELQEGIKYIDKEPFMFDIHPIINNKLIVPTISKWITNHNQDSAFNNNSTIIPNVRYIMESDKNLINNYKFSEKDIEDKVVLYIEGIKPSEKEMLIGKQLLLLRKDKDGSILNWNFIIKDVYNSNHSREIKNLKIEREGLSIIISESTAIKQGLLTGYKNLKIYIDDDLSVKNEKMIYEKIYAITATIPGSIFQYVPEFIEGEKRITEFLSFIGKFSFYISVTLAIISMYIVVHGKYQQQKRSWGIYRSLGMSTNKVFLYLLFEMSILFLISALFSSLVYILFLYLNGSIHTLYYIKFLINILIILFLLIILVTSFIRRIIKSDSIANLLKVRD